MMPKLMDQKNKAIEERIRVLLTYTVERAVFDGDVDAMRIIQDLHKAYKQSQA